MERVESLHGRVHKDGSIPGRIGEGVHQDQGSLGGQSLPNSEPACVMAGCAITRRDSLVALVSVIDNEFMYTMGAAQHWLANASSTVHGHSVRMQSVHAVHSVASHRTFSTSPSGYAGTATETTPPAFSTSGACAHTGAQC